MELAIDTSTTVTSLALSQDGNILYELTWLSQQNQTAELLPNLEFLLSRVKVSLDSVKTIIVAKGPGSFNGLRVGLSTAKGLAFALKVPLIAISTLEIEAYPFALTELPICPIHNAGRGEIAAALYQQKGEEWHRIIEEHIIGVSALASIIKSKTLFCGEISPSLTLELKQRLGEKAIIIPEKGKLRHASYLIELGWKRFQKKDYDDPATLQALYLRRPPITLPKNKFKI